MKVLVTGGTGTIGKHALLHALLRPEITSVVAISRRDLPTNTSNNSKLKVIILKDFNDWSQDILEEIKDADAMIWLEPNPSLNVSKSSH
jgi:nucleoside-diphosphate-sugar epimerase